MGKYYFAYGANTHLASMAKRCPGAKHVGTVTLQDYRLVFRLVADIETSKGDSVHGALWELTPSCEKSLDSFEGFPHLYTKRRVTVDRDDGSEVWAMAYVIRLKAHPDPPWPDYLDLVMAGYGELELPKEQVATALRRALMEELKDFDCDEFLGEWEYHDY